MTLLHKLNQVVLFYRQSAINRSKNRIWKPVLRKQYKTWQSSKQVANNNSHPRVLIATSLGGYDHGTMLESALSIALTLRGAHVDVLLCDEFLPACQLTKISKISPEELTQKGQKRLCRTCFKTGMEIYAPLGLQVYQFRELVKPAQEKKAQEISSSIPIEEIKYFNLDGVAVGEHSLAGALRFYARGDLENEPLGEDVLRRYLNSAVLTVFAVQELLDRNTYDVACFHHGIYVPQGLIGEVCRRRKVRVVNSNPAYRSQTFIFSHGDSYHHTMISEPTSEWENIPWTSEIEKKTLDYLKSRWSGSQDWIWFHEKPQEELSKIAKEIGVDFSRPCIGLLTNVMWDAQLHYQSNAFPNMLEWVLQTIQYFAHRPELQLVIRVHPAEIRGMIPSRQPIVPEIHRAFPKLPPNVFIIPPESQVSTYSVMEQCNAVIIYNTKTGIEVSSMGIPVIVAGEAWIRNKGFSIDACSPEEYFDILKKLPFSSGLDADQLERARKYAFHFFYRRMIELPFIISPQKYQFALQIDSLDDLKPGRYPGLDVICEGILNNTPFVYHAEQILLHDQESPEVMGSAE